METRAGREPAWMPIHSSDTPVMRPVVQAERPDPVTPEAVVRAPDAARRAPLRWRGGRSREAVLFLIGIALIAIHVLDDNYVQPQPGMSPATTS